MEECFICCFKYLEQDFFILSCCLKKICKNCINYLVVPLCPYCRCIINSIKDNDKYKMSISYDSSYLTQSSIQELLTTDINITESRIVRRQIRRRRKLENRELDKRRNKELSRHRKKNILQNQISEEQDIFYFE